MKWILIVWGLGGGSATQDFKTEHECEAARVEAMAEHASPHSRQVYVSGVCLLKKDIAEKGFSFPRTGDLTETPICMVANTSGDLLWWGACP